ncbi:MAG: pectate lyase [Blastocatellia bacterium]
MKFAIILALFFTLSAHAQTATLTWNQAQRQPAEWYGGPEALRIANNLLLWQRDTGGWPKNTDMAIVLGTKQQEELAKQKKDTDSTIDNHATYTQMAFLARVFNASKHARFQDAFNHGLDYLLRAQYPNGGWPQFYPDLKGYYRHITYNDDAMVGVLEILRDIAQKDPRYTFVDGDRRKQAARAVEKGIDCILKTQILLNGKRLAWCAQHDEVTLAPANARSYEKISLSGAESVGIVRFLMSIEKPNPEIMNAIESAVAWFRQAQLSGIKVVTKTGAEYPNGSDRVIVTDASAGPLWARFYEIGTNRPLFCGRDGVIKYSLAEIEYERRNGYSWYSDAAAVLLNRDYPAWRKKR